MDHKIYNWITTPLIFGIWLYIAITAIRKYSRLMKINGLTLFMTRSELRDPKRIEAVKEWKNSTRKLFLLWIITAITFFVLSMIIDRTIGFKD